MTDMLLVATGGMAFRDWVIQTVKVTIILFMICRIGGNIREILSVRGLGVKQARYYTVRYWGACPATLRLLLVLESMAVLVVGAIVVMITGN